MGDAGHKSQPPKGQRKQTDLEGNGKRPRRPQGGIWPTAAQKAFSSPFTLLYPDAPVLSTATWPSSVPSFIQPVPFLQTFGLVLVSFYRQCCSE